MPLASQPLKVLGTVENGEDVSAIVSTEQFLVVGADEGTSLQVLKRTAEGLKTGALIPLPVSKEADIEGLAIQRAPVDGRFTVFAIGCHCSARKQPKKNTSANENRQDLLDAPKLKESRAHVYRLSLDATTGGVVGSVEQMSLSSFISTDKLLSHFLQIPSKENGIDIEGLALGPDGKLFAGFRGPVLRGNFVPVLVFDFDDPNASELRFVNLDGFGIRDLAAVEGGFLILAGPTGDGRFGAPIFFWDGTDQIPGNDRASSPAKRLMEVTPPSGEAKAEGLAVLSENAQKYDVLIAFDSVANGGLTRTTIPKKP
ncbi:MAG: DUF3616 domain-containing protein [Thermoanaerobaculia bacterium]